MDHVLWNLKKLCNDTHTKKTTHKKLINSLKKKEYTHEGWQYANKLEG